MSHLDPEVSICFDQRHSQPIKKTFTSRTLLQMKHISAAHYNAEPDNCEQLQNSKNFVVEESVIFHNNNNNNNNKELIKNEDSKLQI